MNIFAVLDTSDNEEEEKVVQPKKVKDSKPAAPAAEAPAAKTNKPQENKSKTEKSTGSAPRTVPGEKPKAAAAPKVEEVVDEAQKENTRGGRPRGKEGSRHGEKPHNSKEHTKPRESTAENTLPEGAPREEREGQQNRNKGPRKEKREYERRSGTGRGRELSRGGRGPYGFGNVAQDALEAEKDPNITEEATAEVAAEGETATPAAEGGWGPETETAPEPEPVPEPEPAPVVFTLEEHLQKREEARLKSALINNEKKTRSVDTQSQFAGLVAKTDTLVPYIEGKSAKNANGKKEKSTGKEQILDVAFKIETPTYERREYKEFRDRGEGRGAGRGSGRGEGRGPRRENRDSNYKRGGTPAAAVFKENEFPAL